MSENISTLLLEIEKFLRYLASASAEEKQTNNLEISEQAQALADAIESTLNDIDD